MEHRRWLVKTDPRLFSFADLEASSRAVWNGTRNPLALRHLRAMRRGDEVLVYHSGSERSVVGLATVRRGPRLDGTDDAGGDWAVDLAAQKRLERPIPRAELAAERCLASWELIRIPRLTILPVPQSAWRLVLRHARRMPP